MSDLATNTMMPWKKTLVGWLLLLILIVGLFLLCRQQPAMPIVVIERGLNGDERAQLHNVVDALGKQKLYQADLQRISQQIVQLSWVDSVSIYRDWNLGIVVEARPKQAVANFGSDYLLDAAGNIFVPANVAELNNSALARLYGDVQSAKVIMQKTHQLNHWFAPAKLVVEDIVLTSRQTWLVRFNTGLRLTVDQANIDRKLYGLSQLLAEQRLPVALNEIASIDLRYKSGFSLTKKTTVVQTQ